MSELLLNSLEIQNFRAFRHLRIERLGRVNLIVGKNNVGKTSLLEALWLLGTRGEKNTIQQILQLRDLRGDVEALMHQNGTQSKQMQIGSIEGLQQADQLIRELNRPTSLEALIDLSDGTSNQVDRPQKAELFLVPSYGLAGRGVQVHFISSDGLEDDNVLRLWQKIAFSIYDDEVTDALRIIEPQVERVGIIEANTETEPQLRRIIKVRLAGQAYPVPLRSLGEGTVRLFGFALALVNAADGFLLIDEFENGLHYSIQLDVWRLIFQVAARLNVQVFATTHSSDCVAAFQEISQQHVEEGILIRLGRKQGDVVASIYDEELLEKAVEQDVEVR